MRFVLRAFQSFIIVVSASGVLLLSGCESGPIMTMPDKELKEKARECRGLRNPSRTKAMACENYKRECKRRNEKGGYVC